MAMIRPRAAGPLAINTRPVRPQFEFFEPSSESIDEQDAQILHINLPGFTRDQISIRVENSARTITIFGERYLGGNRRSRFEKVFKVPENCNLEKIQDKFENTMLWITIPKIDFNISQTGTNEKGSDLNPKKTTSDIEPTDHQTLPKSLDEEDSTKQVKEPTKAEKVVKKSLEKEKESARVPESLETKEKDEREKIEGNEEDKSEGTLTRPKKEKGRESSESNLSKLAAKKLADRKFLVKAFLVIVAVGAFVSYSFGTYRKPKN